jgi:hypothetical protein
LPPYTIEESSPNRIDPTDRATIDMHHPLFKATANKDISLGHPAGCPGHLRFHCHVHAQKQHARQYYNSSVGSVAVDTKSMTSVASGR